MAFYINMAYEYNCYAYDHQGRMVWKQIAGTNSATKTITYTWDDFNIVAETICTPQSTIVNYNVWGLDLSGTLQGAGGVGGLLAVISPLPLGEGQSEGSMAVPCYDANGNVTEYIYSDGTIAAHYEYSPFGEIAVQSGALADSCTYRFSTKPWCAITGFSEYEYRKYSPSLGRWLSRDPIGEDITFKFIAIIQRYRWPGRWLRMSDGTPNLFSFVNNEPISWFDFDGAVSRKTDDASTTGDPGKKKSPWDGVPLGSIRCNEKCEMEITGCDKWPKILQSCCQKHEIVHLGQIGDSFCKWQTLLKTLPSGEKKEEKCCPDAGKVPKFGTPDMKNMKQWPDGECPAYQISIECMDALLNKNLSHEERKLVLSKIGHECRIMKQNNCPGTPSACINF